MLRRSDGRLVSLVASASGPGTPQVEDYDAELAVLVRKNVTMLSEIQEELSDLRMADNMSQITSESIHQVAHQHQPDGHPHTAAHHHTLHCPPPAAHTQVLTLAEEA